MSSKHNFLLVAVFIGIYSSTTAQVICLNPKPIEELRVMRKALCVNVAGYGGSGSVNAEYCDGFNDQQIIMCGDGTIRNAKSPNNCFYPGTNGRGNVKSALCSVYPNLPDYQKWRIGKTRSFHSFGIRTNIKQIINVKSGYCLNVKGNGHTGRGGIDTRRCESSNYAYHQYFFLRSKGQLLAHGRIHVQKSGLCLDVQSGRSRPHSGANVRIYDCQNNGKQYFGLYKNEEIINEKSRLCLNVRDYTTKGEVDVFACDHKDDQRWINSTTSCNKGYCPLVNRKSRKCLNVHGTQATRNMDVYSHRCTGEQDQHFKFFSGTWVSPTATWSLVGCHANGEVSQTISNSIAYSTEITEKNAIEIGAAIEAGYSFGSDTFGTILSHSLATMWTERPASSQDIPFTCQVYDSGQPFTGGCMWQIKLTTHQTTDEDDELVWKPPIVRCTKGNTAPTCPPFQRCRNEACTMCEEVQERDPWEEMFGRHEHPRHG